MDRNPCRWPSTQGPSQGNSSQYPLQYLPSLGCRLVIVSGALLNFTFDFIRQKYETILVQARKVKLHYKFKNMCANRNIQHPNTKACKELPANTIDPATFTLYKLAGTLAAAEEVWFLSHRFLPQALENYNEACRWFGQGMLEIVIEIEIVGNT